MEKNEIKEFEEQAQTQRRPRPEQQQRRSAQAQVASAANHVTKVTTESEDDVAKIILQSIPADSQITNVRFEGPNIALYTKNPKFALTDLTYYLSSLSKTLKKRFIIRTDPAVRLPEDATRQAVVKLLPKDVQVSAVFCDDATGEVVLEVSRPEAIDPAMIVEIARTTGWIAHTRRSPHIPSTSINTIHSTLKGSAKERTDFLQKLGTRLFRGPLVVGNVSENGNGRSEPSDVSPRPQWSQNREEVMLFCLGGVKQVGRSCFIVVTPESKVMLDCGINPGEMSGLDAYPRIDWLNFNLDELDAVVISHAHIDHQGFLPALFKYGYRGPVYCTEPTLPLMTLLQMDSVKIANSNGTYLPYEARDVHEVIKRTITLPYGKPTDISPDITVTLNNAGHIMGSATVHLNISGAHNILYSGDYKYARTQLLDSAVATYPRVETLITESTYGNTSDIMPDQAFVYRTFSESINKVLSEGGKVLIPVPAVGRAQEIMLVMAKEMSEGRLVESPIYIEGMISEASAIHMSYAHYLGADVRRSVSQGINPFTSEYFTVISGGKREEAINDQNPAIIMATSGMLEGGPSVEYFKELAPNPKNKIIFVSYQINGTLGRRVLDGNVSEVSMMDKSGKVKVVPVRCQTQKIDGFSGHSDFNQIMNFVAKIKPKRVLINHGERTKSENVASAIYSRLKIRSGVPDNREIVRLR
ncbi:KH-domain/beta-lactamase-domain protein [Candidatus Nitrososphaera evergladensis SR1]|uniref:Transcription termination factor FttA n=1 Tax=Candidatus Nitrososphaera evergladensis SR1 TaxID=1459636 RepID=A0A075MXP4_9ARCH|nr:beta-CASP ribonuclease aCPSF1 [Candidatus Nitrososphaera evergladensis]AIF84069.1 KH-domain/beta-lactamase-domain protein [Candidatus Nitrososphaera evergladensis SR1]